ncbi:MAG: hypothetical protein FJ241_10295 [Nitrospira sp.]|nr:hypothetical protein [Nitrospira sp.]
MTNDKDQMTNQAQNPNNGIHSVERGREERFRTSRNDNKRYDKSLSFPPVGNPSLITYRDNDCHSSLNGYK